MANGMANGSDAVAPDMLLGFLFTAPICENKYPLHQKMQTAMRQTPSRNGHDVSELNHEQLVDNQLGLVGLVPGYTPPSQKKVPLPLLICFTLIGS